MRSPHWLSGPPSWLPLPRRTARLRLTTLYGCSFMVVGAGLLAFTYWLFDRATAGTQAASPQGLIVHCKGPASPRPRPLVPRLVPPPCDHLLQLQSAAQNALDLHALLVQSAIALALMAGMAVALGWFVAGRVLRPLHLITMSARRISATSLHERLALAGPDDEFTELADTLDELLARLEASFQAQRNFVASASHELRTPLTLDRTLLQVTLRDPRATVEQWRSTGQEVLESGKQQERLLEALLTLATSEGGLNHRRPVDLSEVTAARILACSQLDRQRLRVQASLSPATLLGDSDLIERLVANLLDNAVQHNTPAGTVDITTRTRDGSAILSVTNSGPAIPAAQVDRLFQPFQRLGTIRANHSNGHGLGLSIVRAIATAHGAALTARACPEGGLHIEVTFPATDGGKLAHVPQAIIRPYRAGDLDDLYRICLQTGDAGEDATSMFDDPRIVGHVFAAPYGLFEPTLAFVAEDELGVGGYIVGALDSRSFEKRLETDWWPPLRQQYPAPPSELSPDQWTPDQRAAGFIHDPLRAPDELAEQYPSHLHINLVARLQSQGLGRQLMSTLMRALRDQGSAGVHFYVWPTNQRAVGFYQHLGFTVISAEDAVIFAMDLRQAV